MNQINFIKYYSAVAVPTKGVCLFKMVNNNGAFYWAGLIGGGKETAKALGKEYLEWYAENGPIAGWAIEHNWTVDKTESNIDLNEIYFKKEEVIPV